MKKVLAVVGVVALAVIGYFGYNYYTSTYVGVDAYARVPEAVPEKVQAKNQSGDNIDGWFEYDYDLTYVKKNGSTQEMKTIVSNENPTPLKPGSIVKVTLSEKRIIKGPNVVKESVVPADVLAKLQ